jgi:hypothetical protein
MGNELQIGNLDGWFVIEDGATIPEGTAPEWREIIRLMKAKETGTGGRRVGVLMRTTGDAEVYSPRNAYDDSDYVLICEWELPAWIEAAEKLLFDAESVQEFGWIKPDSYLPACYCWVLVHLDTSGVSGDRTIAQLLPTGKWRMATYMTGTVIGWQHLPYSLLTGKDEAEREMQMTSDFVAQWQSGGAADCTNENPETNTAGAE